MVSHPRPATDTLPSQAGQSLSWSWGDIHSCNVATKLPYKLPLWQVGLTFLFVYLYEFCATTFKVVTKNAKNRFTNCMFLTIWKITEGPMLDTIWLSFKYRVKYGCAIGIFKMFKVKGEYFWKTLQKFFVRKKKLTHI